MSNFKKFFLISISLIIFSCGEHKGWYPKNINECICKNIDQKITPQMVEKNPEKYKSICLDWYGQISSISEAGPEKVFVIDDIIDNDTCYFSTSEIGLTFSKDGQRDYSFISYFGVSFAFGKFYYYGNTDELFEKSVIKIRASVIGVAKKPSPVLKDRFIESIIFVIHGYEKVE